MNPIVKRELCPSSRRRPGRKFPDPAASRALPLAAFFALPLLLAAGARAQARFFNPQPIAFDPEISVVNTGIINDVQGTVSADRKYVTITARPSNSQLLALHEFSFETNAGGANGLANAATRGAGFVGGVRFNPNDAEVAGESPVNPPVRLVPGAGQGILTRRGMTPVVNR